MSAMHEWIASVRERKWKKSLSYLIYTDAALAVMVAVFFAFPGLYRTWTTFLALSFLGCAVVVYALFSPKMEKGEKTLARAIMRVKVAVYLCGIYLLGAPVRVLQYRVGSGALMSVVIVTLVITSFLILAGVQSEKFASIMNNLASESVSLRGMKVVHPGDIVLCNIQDEVLKKAKDPREIIPFTDRFLHMLVLGPTGCGKTSQIILPMVWQDLQNMDCGVTVLEPKGDLAIKAAMMAKRLGRPVLYFDPTFKNCPKFNPLAGREVDVLENMATAFRMLDPDSPTYFLNINEELMRKAVKVLKRLDRACGVEGTWANLINLSRLLQNSGGQGREIVNRFARITAPTDAEAKENADIAGWFLSDYFMERSKIYENTSGVRSQVAKLVSNEYLRDVLNPDVRKGGKNEVNFDKHLAEGGVICISTAQGALRALSRYLGYFIILSLQSSVFRRPGDENTRRPHFLYIDEFQTYSTPGFTDMLTQGRSYRVGSILATQARAQMAMGGGRDGRFFVDSVSTNARNVVLFPGINKDDAKYYSDMFGEVEKVETVTGYSRKKFNLLTGGLDRLGHPTESIREQKKMESNFSVTDLIFGKDVGTSFGKITYLIVKNNSVQPAKVGQISYIPRELNKELNDEIMKYTVDNAVESAAEYYAHEEEQEERAATAAQGLVFFDSDEEELADLGKDGSDLAFQPEPHEEASECLEEQAAKYARGPDYYVPEDIGIGEEERRREDNEDDSELIDNTGNIFDGIDDLI